MVKRLKDMETRLVNCLEMEIAKDLKQVDAKEMGEVVDMVKDLEEAVYYATITDAMHGKDSYSDIMYYRPDMRDMDKMSGKMYYPYYYTPSTMMDKTMPHKKNHDYMIYAYEYPNEIMRDHREGRSPISRKNYMESKDLHKNETALHLKELDNYLQELGHDITEMIQEASPEEKQLLQQKLSILASKIK